MKTNENKLTVRDVAEEITFLIKEELIARFVEEETGLQIGFLSGQTFRVTVEEIA